MRKMLKGGVGLNERWRALLRRTVIPTACAKKRRGLKRKWMKTEFDSAERKGKPCGKRRWK